MGDKEWQKPKDIEELYKVFQAGGTFGGINRPTSGAREEKELPVGNAKLQLYSLGTPNGQKVSILLEELGVDYDAHVINIMKGDQFTSGFVEVNPNSKIPCMVDKEGRDPSNPKCVNLFESGAILLYLGEKYGKFIPTEHNERAECMNWLFFQMGGQGPLFGQFGHYFKYAPRTQIDAIQYGVNRYGMEMQRMLHVIDTHLASNKFMCGDQYTIADMAIYPWVNCVDWGYNAAEFINISQYKNVARWCEVIKERPAVQRGMSCCNFQGVAKPWLESDAAN